MVIPIPGQIRVRIPRFPVIPAKSGIDVSGGAKSRIFFRSRPTGNRDRDFFKSRLFAALTLEVVFPAQSGRDRDGPGPPGGGIRGIRGLPAYRPVIGEAGC